MILRRMDWLERQDQLDSLKRSVIAMVSININVTYSTCIIKDSSTCWQYSV